MARTKMTPRKRMCGYLPPRVSEAMLAVIRPQDAYEQWERRREQALEQLQREVEEQQQLEQQQQEQSEEEEDPEEVEMMDAEQGQHQEAPAGEQEAPAGQQVAPGGDGSGDDPVDSDDSDDDDDGEQPTPPPSPPAQPPQPERRWTSTVYVRDGGDHFYHTRLLSMLRDHYGSSRVGVEYHSSFWTHPDHPGYWSTEVRVRVTNRTMRAAEQVTSHFALSDRTTQAAGIADAARQALYAYRDRLWGEIEFESDRYLPRRRSGEAACRIASVAEETDPQLVAAVAALATTNTELDAALDENQLLRNRLLAAYEKIENLETMMGAPPPRSPVFAGESPPRKRARYGDVSVRTTVDP